MRKWDAIRQHPGTILGIGSYRPGYQAILDFDFLCGKPTPSLVGVVGSTKHFDKYFWGESEVLVPCFPSLAAARAALGPVDWLYNTTSGRRAHQSTVDFFTSFPEATGAHLFAEGIPEQAALDLYQRYQLAANKTIIGPAGVGLLVPGALKLGVIGGADWRQLAKAGLQRPGSVAVLSASGGMVGELINLVTRAGHGISAALCFGGDRFPATTPRHAFLAAQADPATRQIVYYGELGGQDEYEIVELLRSGQVDKPILAYIAGVIGETFEQPVQFGHAKALAGQPAETASAKRTALAGAGAQVATSMADLAKQLAALPPAQRLDKASDTATTIPSNPDLSTRQASLFTSTIGRDSDEGYQFVGQSLPAWAAQGDIAAQITAGLLGRAAHSDLTVQVIRTIYLLSVDHGPQVAGALNTIITARAGKGLVDSLAAGLLAIGPRFGGAVTDAARQWHQGVAQGLDPRQQVESYARQARYISGIGHRRYRLDAPDPRTAVLAEYAMHLPAHPHLDYARAIEAITTAKKASLILNVDGYIAALMLDVLQQAEGLSTDQCAELIEADFFNALFVIPRVVGFVAHYLDQKRLDEGLFRLPDQAVLRTDPPGKAGWTDS